MTRLGNYRHLMQSSTPAGHFVILAIDHRANLRERLDAAAPQPLSDQDFTAFKMDALEHLAGPASGVLIDPAYGLAAGVARGLISGQQGLLAPLEVTDYGAHPSRRELQFIEGWSVRQAKLAGCSGVKLLLNYHPDAPDAAAKRDQVARLLAECRESALPLFLEPLAYALDPDQTLTSADKRRIVVAAAAAFSALGVDVLKMEFPALPGDDEATWRSALRELDEACGAVPWALLSAGVDYDTFYRQAALACQSGGSGVIAGRAVWGEAVALQGEARAHFLATTARQRMAELAEVCALHAHSWLGRVSPPPTAPDWYLP